MGRGGAGLGLLVAEAAVFAPVALGVSDTYEIADPVVAMGATGLFLGALVGTAVHVIRG